MYPTALIGLDNIRFFERLENVRNELLGLQVIAPISRCLYHIIHEVVQTQLIITFPRRLADNLNDRFHVLTRLGLDMDINFQAWLNIADWHAMPTSTPPRTDNERENEETDDDGSHPAGNRPEPTSKSVHDILLAGMGLKVHSSSKCLLSLADRWWREQPSARETLSEQTPQFDSPANPQIIAFSGHSTIDVDPSDSLVPPSSVQRNLR